MLKTGWLGKQLHTVASLPLRFLLNFVFPGLRCEPLLWTLEYPVIHASRLKLKDLTQQFSDFAGLVFRDPSHCEKTSCLDGISSFTLILPLMFLLFTAFAYILVRGCFIAHINLSPISQCWPSECSAHKGSNPYTPVYERASPGRIQARYRWGIGTLSIMVFRSMYYIFYQ